MPIPKIQFRYAPPSMGGHSLLKIVAFDFQGNSIPIEKRYTFNGRYAPLSKKPQQREKITDVEKGVFKNFDIALNWAHELWENIPKTTVAHGFIADADYPAPGTQIWKKFQVTQQAKKQDEQYLFCLRMKLKTGNYLELKTTGQINTDTGEVLEDWQTCLRDLQAQYTRWAAYNIEAAKSAGTGMVFGDAKKKHSNTQNIELWRINFNAQTGDFTSRKRGNKLKIHDEKAVRQAQNIEETISNYLA